MKGAGEGEDGGSGTRVRRWWLMDSTGREHVAVDTTSWDLGRQHTYVYEAVRCTELVSRLHGRSTLLGLAACLPAWLAC